MSKTKNVPLSRATIWQGQTYGPGEDVEVPADFPDGVQERLDAAGRGFGAKAANPQSPPGFSGSGIGDLTKMDKSELLELAESRGLVVEGTGANGNVLKEDLIAALSK